MDPRRAELESLLGLGLAGGELSDDDDDDDPELGASDPRMVTLEPLDGLAFLAGRACFCSRSPLIQLVNWLGSWLLGRAGLGVDRLCW